MLLFSLTVLDLVKGIIAAINKVKDIYEKFGNEFDKLQRTLRILQSRIDEFRKFDEEMADQDTTDALTIERRQEMQDFVETLKDCSALVEKCIDLPHWKFFKVNDYANRLSGYNKTLRDFVMVNMISDIWVETMTMTTITTERNYGSALPEAGFTVGWETPVKELEQKLLQENVSVIGVCGLGGCGKTTIVTKLCEKIKDQFWKVLFLPVSKSPDVMELVRRLWVDLVNPSSVPKFLTVKDALQQLMLRASSRKPNDSTILVMLDDVWKESDLEKLLIEKPGFKTIVTSRVEFKKKFDWTYSIPQLQLEDAKNLFLHHALSKNEDLKNVDFEVVGKIVEACNRHPLVLKVIAASLEDRWQWKETADGLIQGGSILNNNKFDPDREILVSLEASLKPLNTTQLECFMDLGCFPHNQRLRAGAVIDVWVQLRGLSEDGARSILQQLANRHLIELFDRSGNGIQNQDDSFTDLFVIQHDLLNELSIHYSRKIDQKRLIIDQADLPGFQQPNDTTSCAHIVSIRTGEMRQSDWSGLMFPSAEVLILNFSSNVYCLPPFLKEMENLKVLIIENSSLTAAEINGFPSPGSLKNLRRIRVERLSLNLPLQCHFTEPFLELQKISMVLCEVNQEASNLSFSGGTIFPKVTELEIDYCNGLERLSSDVSDMVKLQKLSITNCHDLIELPEEIGRLSHLEVLRLEACTGLAFLPESLPELGKLRFMDLSECSSLSELPKNISNLQSLRKIDMRGCSAMLPVSVRHMAGLRTVICLEDTAKLWKPFLSYLGSLTLDERKENVGLRFLY